MAVVVRADSTSTSEATPAAAAASVADDFALSSPPANPKSIITPENILAALSGEGNNMWHTFSSIELHLNFGPTQEDFPYGEVG